MNASVPSANISLYIAEQSGVVAMVFATFWMCLPGRSWADISDQGAGSSASNSSSANLNSGRGLAFSVSLGSG